MKSKTSRPLLGHCTLQEVTVADVDAAELVVWLVDALNAELDGVPFGPERPRGRIVEHGRFTAPWECVFAERNRHAILVAIADSDTTARGLVARLTAVLEG